MVVVLCAYLHLRYIANSFYIPTFSLSSDLLSLNYSDDSIVIDVNSSSTYKTSIVLNVDFYTVDPTKLNISTSVSGPAGYFLELFKNESIFFNNSTSELTYSMYVTYYENSDKDSLLLQGGNLTGKLFVSVYICLF